MELQEKSRLDTPDQQPRAGSKLGLRLLDNLIGLGLIACLVFSLAGLAGRIHWLVDLTNHFKVQYLFCCTLALIWFLLRRRPRWLALASVGVVVNGLFITPLYMSPATVNSGASGSLAKLRVFAANVYVGNNQTEELLRQIELAQPDVVLISEYSEEWDELLQPLEIDFPYSTKIPNKGAFGMAVYSRTQFEELKVPNASGRTPTIAGKFAVDDRVISLVSAHPVPPTSREYASNRNAQLTFIGEFVAELDGNVVVCGDLNTTRWSPWFGALTSNGLRDGTEGFGLNVTWPIRNGGFNHWLKQIQIDHCLVSQGVTVDSFQVGKPTGSDHLPIVIDLLF